MMYYLVRVAVAAAVAAIGVTAAVLVEGARLCRACAPDSLQGFTPAPAGFTHPRLLCTVCQLRLASWVVESRTLAPHATDWDAEFDTHYTLCCDTTVCLEWAAQWHNDGGEVHADTYPLLSRAEAEAISGLDLSEASRG